MTIDDVARWHRLAQDRWQQAAAASRRAAANGSEDAAFEAEDCAKEAQRHAEMAAVVEAFATEYRRA